MERKAAFYLGKEYDPQTQRVLDDKPVMYDSRDLTTHAVCIGMTGSGKTGLGVTLLEEAALDGIPSLIIDPKGDMTNLLLTFPDLKPSDFEPWVNLDDARRKDQTVPEYAAAIAQTWAKGLADWGQSGERIRRLKESAEFLIYTPGSDAGLPLSVLRNFQAPPLSWDEDEETLLEMISGTVSGLLALVGIQADPIQSREHILLSRVFEEFWRRGRDLDLPQLIEAIQRPPIAKLGVFDLETVYPERERFQLAMALNRLVAAPSFAAWLKGEAFDIERLLWAPGGKPRVSIFYIAHLDDAERMFFVTLLLEQVIGWMRRQPGTTSLRAILYFDELFGYFPPHPANPASKRPLLTLLKMARAFGLGLMLTTQNPVDLDYKGLTNAGTWFIGKLQTDRDKARVLEGMEGVITESNTLLDRAYLDRLISSLGPRVFVLHNVHAPRPILYQTRWALSYLRGPLTRAQVRDLMRPFKSAEPAPRPQTAVGPAVAPQAANYATAPVPAAAPSIPEGFLPMPPRVNARVAQYYLPVEVSLERARRALGNGDSFTSAQTAHLVYLPYLVASGTALVSDPRSGQAQEQTVSCFLPLPGPHALVPWEESRVISLETELLGNGAEPEALYGPLPEGMGEPTSYTPLRAAFADYIYRASAIPRWVHRPLKMESRIGESREEFLKRCQAAAETAREQALAKIRQRYQITLDRLEQQLTRAERALEDQKILYKGRQQEELLSAGETIVGMFLGRRRTSPLSTASRRRRMTSQARANLEQAEAEVARLKREIAACQEEQEAALAQERRAWEGLEAQVEEAIVRPRKTDIRVNILGIAWVPHWLFAQEGGRAPSPRLIPACRLPQVAK